MDIKADVEIVRLICGYWIVRLDPGKKGFDHEYKCLISGS